MSDLPTIDPSLHAREGTIEFRGYRVWYGCIGEGEELPGRLPLLCLHGGPGASHDYFESLAAMASRGRRVIFYDQLGCGNSDQPDDPSLWTVQLFVEEVDVVRDALGLDRLHVLGQSWGGMLAMEYALTQPVGVASPTVASSPASMTQWVAGANRLPEALPGDVQAVLQHHETAGTTNSSEYQSAMMDFYRRRPGPAGARPVGPLASADRRSPGGGTGHRAAARRGTCGGVRRQRVCPAQEGCRHRPRRLSVRAVDLRAHA